MSTPAETMATKPTMSPTSPQDLGTPLILEDFIPVPAPVTSTSPPLCSACHTPAPPNQRCASCKSIHYCSKTCQASDWRQHKLVCKGFVKAATQPDASRRRTLVFGAEGKMWFGWVGFGDDGVPLDMKAVLGGGEGNGMAKDDIKTIAFHDRYLPYWIQLSYDSNPDSSRTLLPNPLLPAFRGPVVTLAYDPEDGLSKPALNIDTRALSAVVNYARLRAEYEGPVFVEQPQERWGEDVWKVVLRMRNGEGVETGM